MFDPSDLDPRVVADALFDARFAGAARFDIDLATAATWDANLPRNRRILVPIDVQAFVVPAPDGDRADGDDAPGERVVPVTGGPSDPAPFAVGVVPPSGVHLHWAMPDALLRSEDAETGGELTLPPLPDRWVVVRALFPIGFRRPMLRGWVIDAPTGAVMPLAQYDGTVIVDDGARPVFDPLDGVSGGSPLWTSSYTASARRFGLRDPLDDLDDLRAIAKDGFFADHAVYTVAGWWTDNDGDPLSGLDASGVLEACDAFGWAIDNEALEVVHDESPAVVQRLETTGSLGQPAKNPSTTIAVDGQYEQYQYTDISPRSGLPYSGVDEVIIGPHSTSRPAHLARRPDSGRDPVGFVAPDAPPDPGGLGPHSR